MCPDSALGLFILHTNFMFLYFEIWIGLLANLRQNLHISVTQDKNSMQVKLALFSIVQTERILAYFPVYLH